MRFAKKIVSRVGAKARGKEALGEAGIASAPRVELGAMGKRIIGPRRDRRSEGAGILT